jgi:CRP/FNR family transcriptional regulator
LNSQQTTGDNTMSHLNNNLHINTTSNIHVIDPNSYVISERKFLFQMGEQLDGIYRINSGCVKLSRSTADGEKQIIGFYMAGDLIGLDALADGFSNSTAVILETSNISLIPFETILNNNEKFDNHSFIHQLGINVNLENDHTMMLSQSADRRIAWFLTKYSDRLVKRGLCAEEFRIPMTGTDIAFYLGMALETFSREIGCFIKQGLMNKNNKDIQLLDIESLFKIANGDNTDDENSAWTKGFNRNISNKQSVLSH